MSEPVTLCECDCMENGRVREQNRLIAYLREKKALRDSFFRDGLILYTEHAAIDITEAELRGK